MVVWLLGFVLLSFAALAQEPVSDDSGVGVDAMMLIGEPLGAPLAGTELDKMTEDVASRMRCPVCQGLSVADSPTDSALAMKAEVRELLAVGFTQEQTLQYFEKSYGEFIRLEPKAEGFSLLVWVVPVVGLLLGAVLIGFRLRRGSPRTVPSGGEGAPEADEDPELEAYLRQVRQEVHGEGDAA